MGGARWCQQATSPLGLKPLLAIRETGVVGWTQKKAASQMEG